VHSCTRVTHTTSTTPNLKSTGGSGAHQRSGADGVARIDKRRVTWTSHRSLHMSGTALRLQIVQLLAEQNTCQYASVVFYLGDHCIDF
jgi:hypothetical protein